MNDIATTIDLLGALETIIPAPSFFLDRYFRGNNKLSTRAEISFDEVFNGLPYMAPLVSPDLPGKPNSRAGYHAKTFVPAYVKPIDTIKPSELLVRRPGEAFGGDRSPEERLQEDIVNKLAKQKNEIWTRIEFMAAQTLIDGKIKMEGEDYPTQVVDFNRSEDNTVVISDPAQVWSNKSANIAAQMEKFSNQILEKTGYAGTDVIMTPSVWEAFQNNDGVLRAAELRRGITNVPFLGPQAATAIGAQFKGMFGSFSIFVYARPFKEQDGKIVSVLGDGDVLFVAPPDQNGNGGVEGIKAFGAIQDLSALYPTDFFAKAWEEQNPGRMQLMTQSAPLMIPGRPNATLKATVLQ